MFLLSSGRKAYVTRMLSLIPGSVLPHVSVVSSLDYGPVYAPGMMYVSERSADSICDTALLFLVMKSEYMLSHLVGCDSTLVALCVASLIIFAVASVRG